MAATCAKSDAPLKPAAELSGNLEVLNEYIIVKNMGVLNADDATSVAGVVTGNGLLQSSTDAQLLIQVPFIEAVKLKAIRIRAEEGKGAGSAVRTVRIYVNNMNINFNDVDSIEPTDVIRLSASEASVGAQKDVKYVKFQNVRSLTLFVEDNQTDDDKTFLNNITFIGTVLAGTNMKDLKKTG